MSINNSSSFLDPCKDENVNLEYVITMKILVYFWKGKIAPRPGKEEEEGKKRSVFGIDKEAGDLTIVAQFKDQTTRLKNIDKLFQNLNLIAKFRLIYVKPDNFI